MPRGGLRDAHRATPQTLAPRAPVAGLTLHGLGRLLATLRLLAVTVPHGGAPPIGVKSPEAQRVSKLLQLPTYLVLAPSTAVRPDGATGGIAGVPEPAWLRWRAHVTPPLIACRRQPATQGAFVSAAEVDRPLRRAHMLQDRRRHLFEGRGLFLRAFLPVWGRTCQTRAGSRIPLACRALSTLWRLTAGAGPASGESRKNVRPAQRCARQRYRCVP